MKGYFRKRGDKWSFTVDVGKDPSTGKRIQKTRSGFKTKKEAQAKANELIHQFNQGVTFESKDVLISDFMDHWLNSVAKHRVKDSTFVNYKRAVVKRIVPRFGKIKLTELKLHHGQEYVNELIEDGLSERYIEYVFTVFGSAMKYALKSNLVLKHPFDYLELPRPRRKTMNTWSPSELKKFVLFAKMENPFYYIPLLLAAHTGMRRSEFLGLKWEDIDFERNKITVNRAIIYNEEKKQFTFSDLKTNSSYRQISIDDNLISELRKHLVKQKEMKLLMGGGYDDWGLVSCREDGKPIYGRQLAHVMDRVAKKAELPKIRIHDLRHTHATVLLKYGVNPKVVAERLGHSSIKMTLDVYSHVTNDMQEDTAKIIGNALSF
ncbi:site-specific integrase [Halalkalibacter krulwichiae]|uniref:Transposase from transposon Tn916 n=1 Tax=Halalkalibacter krulwichiae TaxID=199441 RepID=A0A1Y9THJ6_9BACI|nr:tyrosine-type recombinase/integrase [Halalkalibacter krulwichiae]ARK28737.1 Transposase from transposon Tn916 [Halalkalibacter krulwichiae]